jgi:hypothetical protein
VKPVEIAQDDRLALLLGERRDRGTEVGHRRSPLQVVMRCEGACDLVAAQWQRVDPVSLDPFPAFVPRDRCEPGAGVAHGAASPESFVRRQERRLRCILGLVGVTQNRAADAEDHAPVSLEELAYPRADGPLIRVADTQSWCNRHAQLLEPRVLSPAGVTEGDTGSAGTARAVRSRVGSAGSRPGLIAMRRRIKRPSTATHFIRTRSPAVMPATSSRLRT